jgi:hypothetical protein
MPWIYVEKRRDYTLNLEARFRGVKLGLALALAFLPPESHGDLSRGVSSLREISAYPAEALALEDFADLDVCEFCMDQTKEGDR